MTSSRRHRLCTHDRWSTASCPVVTPTGALPHLRHAVQLAAHRCSPASSPQKLFTSLSTPPEALLTARAGTRRLFLPASQIWQDGRSRDCFGAATLSSEGQLRNAGHGLPGQKTARCIGKLT
jgi:hypothetical protein